MQRDKHQERLACSWPLCYKSLPSSQISSPNEFFQKRSSWRQTGHYHFQIAIRVTTIITKIPSWPPKLLQNHSLEHCLWEIFVTITNMIPPEDFLCNVAATGVSIFAREHAKGFALYSDCLLTFTKLVRPKQLLCKGICCKTFGWWSFPQNFSPVICVSAFSKCRVRKW